jgi:hypothetical protein
MRKKTVRDGLRLVSLAIFLVILGTFYSREIGGMLFWTGGAIEFVQLTFFWGGILGGAGILMIGVGLLRPSLYPEKIRLLPSLALVAIMLGLFLLLFGRALSTPPAEQPLRPGETLII